MTIVKRSFLWGESFLVFALLLLFVLSYNNPFFIDSALPLILYFVLLPFVLGGILGLVSYPIARLISNDRAARKSERAAMWSVSGFLFCIFLLYLFVLFLIDHPAVKNRIRKKTNSREACQYVLLYQLLEDVFLVKHIGNGELLDFLFQYICSQHGIVG